MSSLDRALELFRHGLDRSTSVSRSRLLEWLNDSQANVDAGGGSKRGTANGALTKGRAVQTINGGRFDHLAPSRHRPIHGIALANVEASATDARVQTTGVVSGEIRNLGAGPACAVGLDVDNNPVRATDSACVTAPNWLGYCDEDGTITVAPRRDVEFNVLDWGLDPTGAEACDADFQTLLTQTSSGDVVVFAPGKFAFLETINMPRIQMGVEIRGFGGQAAHAIFPPLKHTILSFANAEGDGVRACTDPTTNSHGFLTLRNLVIDQTNEANRDWDSEATDAWLKGGAAVGMIGGQRLNMQGCAVTGAWRFGLAIDGGEICSAVDCDFNNTKPGGEVEGEQSFGIWLADGNRGMSVTGATNVLRFRNCNGNAPSFLWLIDGCAAVTICDGMTNIQANVISGYAMVRGGSYISVKNGYAEGDNAVGAAMFYFCGGQSVNFRIEGGFYTGVGVAFAHLGPSPFSATAGQAAGLEIHGVDLACDWIVGSNYINNCHMSVGNVLSGDIATVRSGQMYDVEPGHTSGLIANTGQATGYFMGTAGNPTAQHHWALKQYDSALHLDGTAPYEFRKFWVESLSKQREERTPYSAITGLKCQAIDVRAYGYTLDDGPDITVGDLVVGDRVYGTATATVNGVWATDETKTAYWKIRQRFRRAASGDIVLVGDAVVVEEDHDTGFPQPIFDAHVATQSLRVQIAARTDGQAYYFVHVWIEGVHP